MTGRKLPLLELYTRYFAICTVFGLITYLNKFALCKWKVSTLISLFLKTQENSTYARHQMKSTVPNNIRTMV